MVWRTDDLRASAAAGVGALTACSAVLATVPTDLIVAEQRSPVFSAFLSPAWAGTVAVIAALVVIGFTGHRPRRGVVGIIGLLGCTVLATPVLIDVSTALSVTVAGLGSGLILAASALLAHRRRGTFAVLVLGAASAYGFSQWSAQRPTDRFRWSVTLPRDPFYPEPVVPVTIMVVAAVLFASVITLAHHSAAQQSLRRWSIATAAVVVWAGYAFLGDYTASVGQWVVATALSVVVTVCVAASCERNGAFLCAGLGVAATSVGVMAWSAWWLVPLALIGFAVGAVCAWRAPSVPVGCTVLALVCASALAPYTVVSTAAYAVVLPAAAVYALLSCWPTDPAIGAVGLLIPTMLSVFALSAPPVHPYDFVWTTTMTGDVASASVFVPGAVGSAAPVAVVIATCTALIAAGAAVVCARRRPRAPAQ